MKYRQLVLPSPRMAPAPEGVGPTLQPPSGPILRSAPGEVTLEELGWFQRPTETPGPRVQHLLLLQLPAVGFHLLRRSSKHHPLATKWIPWPSSPPDQPPPSPSSFERGAGWLDLRRPPPHWPLRPAGALREAEDETQRPGTSPEQSKRP